MIAKPTGGPAFPCELPSGGVAPDANGINRYITAPYPGMTLRDYFAAKAMAAIILRCGYNEDYAQKIVAKDAYDFADAMIAERDK